MTAATWSSTATAGLQLPSVLAAFLTEALDVEVYPYRRDPFTPPVGFVAPGRDGTRFSQALAGSQLVTANLAVILVSDLVERGPALEALDRLLWEAWDALTEEPGLGGSTYDVTPLVMQAPFPEEVARIAFVTRALSLSVTFT